MTGGVLAFGPINNVVAEEEALFPKHPPLGSGQGIYPGRVVWIHDPEAVHWNGAGYWWQPENFSQAAVLAMIRNGLMSLSGAKSPAEAWEALFAWRNAQNGKSGAYKAGQKIAIKPNMNGSGEFGADASGRTGASYGNAVVMRSLLQSLVKDGHVDPRDITIYDACRIFPDYMRSLCSGGPLSGVNFRQREAGGAGEAIADTSAPIQWSAELNGERTFLPKCLTEAEYLINLGTLKGHGWGMSLTAKNHFGTLVNSDKVRPPQAAGLHENFIENKPGDYSVLTDLMAEKHIGGKSVLWMLDALITPPDEVSTVGPQNSRWRQPPFNGGFVASLFFSLDPVAIDSVGADFLASEATIAEHNSNFKHKKGMENYLHEAALLDNPPSGTKYAAGSNKMRGSLGVHEHWNNVNDKQYSRNLGKDEGIELIKK